MLTLRWVGTVIKTYIGNHFGRRPCDSVKEITITARASQLHQPNKFWWNLPMSWFILFFWIHPRIDLPANLRPEPHEHRLAPFWFNNKYCFYCMLEEILSNSSDKPYMQSRLKIIRHRLRRIRSALLIHLNTQLNSRVVAPDLLMKIAWLWTHSKRLSILLNTSSQSFTDQHLNSDL